MRGARTGSIESAAQQLSGVHATAARQACRGHFRRDAQMPRAARPPPPPPCSHHRSSLARARAVWPRPPQKRRVGGPSIALQGTGNNSRARTARSARAAPAGSARERRGQRGKKRANRRTRGRKTRAHAWRGLVRRGSQPRSTAQALPPASPAQTANQRTLPFLSSAPAGAAPTGSVSASGSAIDLARPSQRPSKLRGFCAAPPAKVPRGWRGSLRQQQGTGAGARELLLVFAPRYSERRGTAVRWPVGGPCCGRCSVGEAAVAGFFGACGWAAVAV